MHNKIPVRGFFWELSLKAAHLDKQCYSSGRCEDTFADTLGSTSPESLRNLLDPTGVLVHNLRQLVLVLGRCEELGKFSGCARCVDCAEFDGSFFVFLLLNSIAGLEFELAFHRSSR